MAIKIRMKVGPVEIDYEGPEALLKKELPQLITQLSGLAQPLARTSAPHGSKPTESPRPTTKSAATLAAFLTDKKVGKNQNKRFLATAAWLHQRGNKELKTADVSRALREAHQKKLTNPSQCLASNVSSGYCEKHGRNFYVTDDGRDALG